MSDGQQQAAEHFARGGIVRHAHVPSDVWQNTPAPPDRQSATSDDFATALIALGPTYTGDTLARVAAALAAARAEGAVTEPRTATAAEKPCELYRHHEPAVVQTAGHHIHPIYLQNEVYGRIRDPQLKWLCPNCHTAVHEVIGWMLGESRKPNPMPGRNVLAEARRTVAWYRTALEGTA